MKHLLNYKNFNEEFNWKSAVIGGALVGGSILAAPEIAKHMNREQTVAVYNETDIEGFPEYEIKTKGTFTNNLNVTSTKVLLLDIE